MNFDYDRIENLVNNTAKELWEIDPNLKSVLNRELVKPTVNFIRYIHNLYLPEAVRDLPIEKIEKIMAWALLGPNLVIASTLYQLLWQKDRNAVKSLPGLAEGFVGSLIEEKIPTPFSSALQIILRTYVKPSSRVGRQPLIAIQFLKFLKFYYYRYFKVDPAQILLENIRNDVQVLLSIWFIGVVASKDPWDPPECNYSAWGIVKMAEQGLYKLFLDLMDEEWRSRWERSLQEFLSEYRHGRRRYG